MNAQAEFAPVRRMLATPHQRMYARTLMRQLDLDTRRLTLMHRGYFETAQVTFPGAGEDVDAALCALTKAECSALVMAMKAEVPSDDP